MYFLIIWYVWLLTGTQIDWCLTLEYWIFLLSNQYSLFLFFIFNFYSVIIVCIFSPSPHLTPANPTSLLHLYPPPWFSSFVIYSISYTPFSPQSLPHSPQAIVTLFLTLMSLVIFCLLFSFVDYVPVKGEIIWYLSLTTWLFHLA